MIREALYELWVLINENYAGAFLIPYCIMVFLCGIPLQVLELAVGQYTRAGPVDAMKDICPLLSGFANTTSNILKFNQQ